MTLEQVINEIRKFADAHLQIKSFFEGRISEENLKKDAQYCRMMIEYVPSKIDQGNETFEFRVGVFDRVNNNVSNRTNVLSDTRQVLTDFISYFKNNPANSTLLISLPVTVTDYFEFGGDGVAGHFCDVVLNQYQALNYCGLPVSGSLQVSNGSNVYDQNGTLLYTLYPGQSLTVEVIQQIIQTLTDPAPITIAQTLT